MCPSSLFVVDLRRTFPPTQETVIASTVIAQENMLRGHKIIVIYMHAKLNAAVAKQ